MAPESLCENLDKNFRRMFLSGEHPTFAAQYARAREAQRYPSPGLSKVDPK